MRACGSLEWRACGLPLRMVETLRSTGLAMWYMGIICLYFRLVLKKLFHSVEREKMLEQREAALQDIYQK